MEIATLETILACYNPICNADSMHVVPNVNRVHPLFHHTWKTAEIHDSPRTLSQESSLTTSILVSLLALQVHFRTMGMNQLTMRMHAS